MRTLLPTLFVLLPATVLAAPVAACAQGGCVNSPENPTLVLTLVACAAAVAARVRERILPK